MGFLPGLRELALVALVAYAVFARSSPLRRAGGSRRGRVGPLQDRAFLILAAVASAAVASWVATRTIIARHDAPRP